MSPQSNTSSASPEQPRQVATSRDSGRLSPAPAKETSRPAKSRRTLRSAPTRSQAVAESRRNTAQLRPQKRSRELALAALVRANDVRRKRARLKRDLEAGRLSIAALVLDPPAYAEKARIGEFLLAVPKVGRVKAARILQSQRLSTSKTFGALTQRQRNELSEALR